MVLYNTSLQVVVYSAPGPALEKEDSCTVRHLSEREYIVPFLFDLIDRPTKLLNTTLLHTTMEMPPTKATSSAAAETPTTRKASVWTRLHAEINHTADMFFYRLGSWVAAHTRLTVLGSTVFVIVCCVGFLNFSTEANGEYWCPLLYIKRDSALWRGNTWAYYATSFLFAGWSPEEYASTT